MQRRNIAGLAALTLAGALLAVACHADRATDPPPLAERVVPPAKAYTLEELRAVNRYAWVGAVHKAVVHALLAETRKPGSRAEACVRAIARITQDDLGPGAPTLTPYLRQRMLDGIVTSAACGVRPPRASTRTAAWIPVAFEDTIWVSPSSTAQAMMWEIEATTGSAGSNSAFTSAMSSYYNASLSMSFPDNDAVQFAIGLAESSWSDWSPYQNYPTIEQGEVDYLAGCGTGAVSQGTQYETDAGWYQCQGGEWLQIANPGWGASRPMFRSVALQNYYCGTNADDRGKEVGAADVGAGIAAGLAALKFWGWYTSSPVVALGQAFYAASAGGVASYLAYKRIAMFMAEC